MVSQLPILVSVLTVAFQASESLYTMPSCVQTDGKEDCIEDEKAARKYVDSLSEEIRKRTAVGQRLNFEYSTNITDENAKKVEAQTLKSQEYFKNVTAELRKYAWDEFTDAELRRRATMYFIGGTDVSEETVNKVIKLSTELNELYSTGKICKYEERELTGCNKTMGVETDIAEAMKTSSDYNELLYLWEEWRDVAAGKEARKKYLEFIELTGEIEKKKGFEDLKESWLFPYETEDFPSLVMTAWRRPFTYRDEELSLEKLYKQVHAFVRGKLADIYNEQGGKIENGGTIPAHLLGNVWAQQWRILDKVLPFPKAQVPNITAALIEGKHTVKQIFEMADKFYQSIGFKAMTDKFWKNSMLEKPKDGRDVICHGSASDMMEEGDFRIKMCGSLTEESFKTVHHEMGHVQYYMQYQNQDYIYRQGANPGFHEAIGDTMALAVMTLSHLEKIELLKQKKTSQTVKLKDGSTYEQSDINYLMNMALEKVVFLPYALVLDNWRWKLFTGELTDDNLNEGYWKLREELQGVSPPVARDESHLDPVAKYHVPSNTPYIRYFVSYVSQFQFYESLCTKADEYDPKNRQSKPLHHCDFSKGGKEATETFRSMMAKGNTGKWTEAMAEVTGEQDLSGFSLIKYFYPLYKFLKEQNENDGNIVGWGRGETKANPEN